LAVISPLAMVGCVNVYLVAEFVSNTKLVVTVLPVPTFLVSKVPEPVTVTVSVNALLLTAITVIVAVVNAS
jgi:hypothetical protein